MKIVRCNLYDVPELSTLFDDYRQFYGKAGDLSAAMNFLTDRIKNDESVIFISRSQEGGITGFVQLYPIFSSTRMKRLWLLNDLFVTPASRKTGTSVALISQAKFFARETLSCGIILETAKSNHIANKLYMKSGFVADNDHNYYEWCE